MNFCQTLIMCLLLQLSSTNQPIRVQELRLKLPAGVTFCKRRSWMACRCSQILSYISIVALRLITTQSMSSVWYWFYQTHLAQLNMQQTSQSEGALKLPEQDAAAVLQVLWGRAVLEVAAVARKVFLIFNPFSVFFGWFIFIVLLFIF